MRTRLSRILDECIDRINKGETIESCLADYPDMQGKLEPLLHTAMFISTAPKVTPSDEFVRVTRTRLMTRLYQESIRKETVKPFTGIRFARELTTAWQSFLRAFTGARKVTIPVTVALVLALVVSFSGALNFLSPPPALASQNTLSVLSGSIAVQNSPAEKWQEGSDGMLLPAGTRVRAAANSHALLTFFDGSTIKLEPDTEVEIQRVEYTDQQSATIVLKQWLGKTWSHVAKTAGHSSHYQIETPSASVVAQGTLFTTEVAETGFTIVATTEGLVSITGQGEEIYLPIGQQTQVEAGRAPSNPTNIPDPDSEIVITIDTPAVGSVSDPTGSSTGYLPNGLAYNQITGSQFSSPSDGTQVITINEPVSGEYIIVLRYAVEGTANFSIQGNSGDEVTFAYAGTWGSTEEGGWLIHLNLQVESGLIVGGEVSGVEPLVDEAPENIVEVELALEEAIPIEPADDTEPEKGKGKAEEPSDDTEPEKGNGKPEQPSDDTGPEKGNGNGKSNKDNKNK